MLFRSLTNLQLVGDSERPLLTVHLSHCWPQLLNTATHHDCEFLQELKKLVGRQTYRMTHGLIRNSIPCPILLSAFLLFPVVISPQHNRTEQRIPSSNAVHRPWMPAISSGICVRFTKCVIGEELLRMLQHQLLGHKVDEL